MIAAAAIGKTTCTTCSHVAPVAANRCTRCGSSLRPVDPRSLQWVWAFWITGIIAYIPANLYPMLVTSTLGQSTSNTIIGGAVEIAQHGDYAIAGIVLFASVVIPVAKFIAIAYLALSIQMRRPAPVRHMHHLHEIIEFIGRWSMIDVFVVAILAALVQLSALASIQTGPAALTFAVSVIFTMLSAQCLDTRLIWTLPVTEDENHRGH
ncbi:MAG: paraquat-inducible protein A [Pseudomonadota bacterium]